MKKSINHFVVALLRRVTIVSKRLSDERYLKIMYKGYYDTNIDLNNPIRFSEKMQWLKLNFRKPICTTMVDKYAVKQYISNIVGDKYVVPTLGIFDTFDEIDFSVLPDQFVIKCTHDSGTVLICNDKASFNIKKAKRIISKSLKRNFYYRYREWPYKDVKPRIIIEKFINDENGNVPKDFKVFVFNGNPMFLQVDIDRFVNHTKKMFYTNWEETEFIFGEYPKNEAKDFAVPDNASEAINVAKALAHNFPFLRVDFFIIGSEIYVGELTFFPAGGFGKFNPPEWDIKVGEWIKLPFCEEKHD